MTSRTGAKNSESVRRGFTLLELVAVMTVIATVLAMAAPSLRGFFASRQTEDVARRLLAATRYCRSQAISQGRTYRLVLDEGRGAWWIRCDGSTDSAKQKQASADGLRTSLGRKFRLPDGVAMEIDGAETSAGVAELAFPATGTRPVTTVRLSGKQDVAYVVSCLSATESFTMRRENGS